MFIFEAFESFSDNQRVIRLRECQEIQKQVIQCQREEEQRKQHEAERLKKLHEEQKVKSDTSNRSRLRFASIWKKSANKKNDGESQPTQSDSSTLQSETHETKHENVDNNRVTSTQSSSLSCSNISQDDVWACRALALQCGNELISLNDCFKRRHETDEKISCSNEQDILGMCVSKNASALESRLKERQYAARKKKATLSDEKIQ